MSRKFQLIVLFLFLLIGGQTYSQSAVVDPKLASIEDQYFNALKTKDYQNMDAYYDEAFIGVMSNGKMVDRAAMLNYQATNDLKIEKSFEEIETVMYGNIAICQGIEINKAKTGTVLGKIRFTRVFIKRESGWKILKSQFTSII